MRKSMAAITWLLAATLLALSTQAWATYPTKPVTIIVPFAPGGPSDVLARIVAENLSRQLGQQFVVENIGGAAGTIGGGRAARATPDGYTLVAGNLGSHGAAYYLYKSITYDPREQVAIGMIAGTPTYFAVRKDFPAQTLAEFVAYAKQRPEKVTYGHAGLGSTSHLACLYLSRLTGIKMQGVSYRGTGAAMNDLVSGQIDAMCDQAPSVVIQAQAKSVRALVVALASRNSGLPETPSADEANLPNFRVTGWNALFAPKGTPPDIAATLSRALNAVLSDPAVRKRIEDLGCVFQPSEQTPAGLAAFVRSEIQKWSALLEEAGVTPQ